MAPSKLKTELLCNANAKVRDLSDFCQMWPELKSLVTEKDIQETGIETEIIQLILRLYQLADHICPGKRL